MSDKNLDEFFEKVGSESSPNEAPRPIRSGAILLANDEPSLGQQEDEEEAKAGKLVQYSHFKTGFLPTSSTISKLPAGCYVPKVSDHGPWLEPLKLTTDDLIRFPDTKSDSVISEVEKFWTLKEKFRQYGFSHKRGFMLWGPPGGGKTSCVAIIVQKMIEKGGCVLIADHPTVLSMVLPALRSVEPNRPLAVIWEDLDAVIERYGESEVLAVLDGESQVDNIVFIATTNYPEKLDARITNRPSRFDRIEKIGMPSAEARALYLTKKLGTTIAPDGTDLVKATDGFSVAHLRELIVAVYCQEAAVGATLERLKKMKVQPNSGHTGSPLGLT